MFKKNVDVKKNVVDVKKITVDIEIKLLMLKK